jgi:hypothetical protein
MGTLKLSISEEIDITYGGFTYNYTTTGDSDDLEIADVDAYTAQTLVVGTAFTQIAKFENGATPGMGLYDKQKIKYVRIRIINKLITFVEQGRLYISYIAVLLV